MHGSRWAALALLLLGGAVPSHAADNGARGFCERVYQAKDGKEAKYYKQFGRPSLSIPSPGQVRWPGKDWVIVRLRLGTFRRDPGPIRDSGWFRASKTTP